MKLRLPIAVLGTGVMALALTELLVRLSGATDFPLYLADNEIGYIPSPSQSGRFLRKNDWQFNSKSMGAPEFAPSKAMDNLLIGDSVVHGGNPFKEADRLGPQLGFALGQPVWPVSAGSWSLRNELKYLKLNPEVVGASDSFIFVLNDGDFDEASSWSCEKTHPRSRPWWATLHVFRKYVWDWRPCGEVPADLRVAPGNWRQELREFLLSDEVRHKPVLFVLYPDQAETEGTKGLGVLESHASQVFAVAVAADAKVRVLSIARDARWQAGFYRDAIHPSEAGTRVLAEIIARPAESASLTH